MKSASRSAVRTLSPRRRNSREQSDLAASSRGTSRRRRTRTPRIPPDLPGLELTEEEFLNEWSLTRDQEEAKLVEFRKLVEAEVGPLSPTFDKYYLRRFLRARQHDLQRAKEMFLAHLNWRAQFGTDTLLDEFHFEERDAFLSLYPQGYHKTDRLGRPVYIQHLGQINVRALQQITTEDRMLRYHVQEYERALRYIFPACSLVAGQHICQTLAIMDLKGVGMRHLSGDVKRILGNITRTDQDNYPETLGKTLIINAPGVFRAIWALVKPMLDSRTQAKIEVCPADYMRVLARWIDPANIPQYLGGQSVGLLIDDVGPWSDPAIIAEIDAQIARRDAGEAVDEGAWAAWALRRSPSPLHDDERIIEVVEVENLKPEGPPTSEPEANGPSVTATSPVATLPAPHEEGEEFYDALTRRLSSVSSISSAAYMSADEGVTDAWLTSDVAASLGPRRQPPEVAAPERGPGLSSTSDIESAGGERKESWPSPPAQISILARVRALEDSLVRAERPLIRHLSPGTARPSRAVGQGTLLARVAALERAMETVLAAQQVAVQSDRGNGGDSQRRRGCLSPCCCVM